VEDLYSLAEHLKEIIKFRYITTDITNSNSSEGAESDGARAGVGAETTGHD
jgi:hypothetical protein